MSAMDDALDALDVAAPRRPRARHLRFLLGAAAGSAAGIAALAAVSGLMPTLGPGTPIAWAGVALLGATAGGVLAARSERRAEALVADATATSPSVPEVPTAALHVVSGATRRALEAAVAELAARYLARGERVLVVDAGRRLALHDWFGADPRLGLVECLAGRLPLLGLVQNGGQAGFYLLAHGAPTAQERWSQLGRLFEEAWPHFGRILMVVDPGAQEAIGDALRGRLLRGWWSGAPGALPRPAIALSQRLGIWFERIDLDARADATLETIGERVEWLRALAPAPLAEPVTVPLTPPPVVRATPARAPEVLACNLQVRERLRFLIWMRGVQAESRRVAPVPA